MSKRLIITLSLACAAAIALLQPGGLSPEQARGAALIMLAIIFWATSVLPEYLTALLLLLSAVLLSVAPPDIVFSGFSSTAMWLIFSGLIFGMAINVTGLGDRLSATLSRQVDGSYTKLISGIVIISVLIGFLMPSSMGRAVLLIPIAMALATRCGFAPGSKGRTGTALAAALGCHVPTFAILPANVPNMVLIGSVETIHGITLGYAEYLLLHFPVLGLLKALLIIAVILFLFPDQPKHLVTEEKPSEDTTGQRKLLVVLGIALLFWLTDSLHHVSPAWIGMSAAIFLLLPGIGLVDNKTFSDKMNFNIMLFLAGILALGAIVNSTGLGNVFATAINHWLPLQPDHPVTNYSALSATAITTALVATLPGVPAILTPFASEMAVASGMSIEAVLMTQVIGFSTLLFPYQSGPMLIAMQLSGEPIRHAVRACLVLGILSIVLLLPLNYLWWQVLGWI